MTSDQLEAVIRRELTAIADTCRRRPAALTGRMNIAVDAILAAATAYAIDQFGITADRRNVLAEATAPRGRKPR